MTTAFAELLATPGVEEAAVVAGPVGLLAFHGGLEEGTEVIAADAARASGASLYTVVQPATLRWHLPSHEVGAGASPLLSEFLAHVEVAIAVHGYGRPGRRQHLLLGGRNRDLAASLASAFRRHLPGWVVIDDLAEIPREMRGLHRDNPVNRPRLGGVQLELPVGARSGAARDAVVAALVEGVQSTSNVPPVRQ